MCSDDDDEAISCGVENSDEDIELERGVSDSEEENSDEDNIGKLLFLWLYLKIYITNFSHGKSTAIYRTANNKFNVP